MMITTGWSVTARPSTTGPTTLSTEMRRNTASAMKLAKVHRPWPSTTAAMANRAMEAAGPTTGMSSSTPTATEIGTAKPTWNHRPSTSQDTRAV